MREKCEGAEERMRERERKSGREGGRETTKEMEVERMGGERKV